MPEPTAEEKKMLLIAFLEGQLRLLKGVKHVTDLTIAETRPYDAVGDDDHVQYVPQDALEVKVSWKLEGLSG